MGGYVPGQTVDVVTLSQTTHELDQISELRVVEAVAAVAEHVTVGGKDLSASQLVERLGFSPPTCLDPGGGNQRW